MWAVENFVLPPRIECSTEMGCVMFSGRPLPSQGEVPHPSHQLWAPALCWGRVTTVLVERVLGRKTKHWGPSLDKPGQVTEDIL